MPSKTIFWSISTKVCFGSLMITEGSKLRQERLTREKQVTDKRRRVRRARHIFCSDEDAEARVESREFKKFYLFCGNFKFLILQSIEMLKNSSNSSCRVPR